MADTGDDPKKLLIFREHSIGGVLYTINSNVQFDEVVVIDTTSESTAGKNADDYDEIQILSVDGDYGSSSWYTTLKVLEERIERWKTRQKELELKREET